MSHLLWLFSTVLLWFFLSDYLWLLTPDANNGKEFLDHLQQLDECAVLGGHISFENLLDVVGNAENHLATAQDFCYAFHGPAFPLMFL